MSDKKKKSSVQSRIVKVTCVGATEVSLDELVVIQGNFKDLTEEAYLALSQSIRQEGVCEAFGIWIRPEDGAKCVVSGTQRLRTLKRMRDQEGFQVPLLPASIVEAKTEAEALRKVVALASQAGDVTTDGLYELLHRIGGDAEEILAGFRNPQINVEEFLEGFIRDDLPAAGDGAVPTNIGLTDPDSIPENVKEVRVKRGEIWILGEHRLMCGDSTSPDDVRTLMAGQKASLWSSDPPYGINHVEVSQEKGQSKGYKKIANDHLQDEALKKFIFNSIDVSLPYMNDNFAFYMWHAMKMQAYFSQAAAAAAAAAGILFHRQIIWVKPQFVFGRGHYHWRHELCLMGWKQGSEPPFYGERNQSTVWEVAREMDKIHPTQKPVELFAIPIRNHLKTNEIVYEPFSGSGSNFIAAEQCGVRCFGMELEPHYCQVIIDRWEAFTGKKAKVLAKPKLRKKQAPTD